ncbi:MAG TPA: pentapeptide repeat-containing protein, partial [Flavobacterium sp.]|nr:pentapeptide repeat-containing protein [Flavobacterium sp.]
MYYIENETFARLNFAQLPEKVTEFEDCFFEDCDFQGATLNGLVFIRCTFSRSNFSLADFSGSQLQEVRFNDCKLSGARFEHANPFNLSFSFYRCNLSHSLFTGLK